MDTPLSDNAQYCPEAAPCHATGSTTHMEIAHLARVVIQHMQSGMTALDAELLQALSDLGSRTADITRIVAEHNALFAILSTLHDYSHFDPSGTECDDQYRAAKRRARRAASGAPSALWSAHAEREALETFLAAPDERTLDDLVSNLAEAAGYMKLIDVSWRYWHFGRHAQEAACLGMDGALVSLFAAAWQIQHHVLGNADPAKADQERQRIREAHRAAQAMVWR